jgi:spore coat-associated protein N
VRASRSTIRRFVLSGAVLGSAAAMVALGTFATFTSSTSASQPVSSGTVTLALGATGAVTNRLTVAASGLVPGDTMQRAFDLTSGTSLGSIDLTTTASPSSLLDTDTTNGLKLVVDRCSVAWTEAGTSPAFTYTCGGTLTTVVASRAVIGTVTGLPGLSALTGGGTDHLRATLTLPSGASNSFKGIASTITYAFIGNQLAPGDA